MSESALAIAREVCPGLEWRRVSETWATAEKNEVMLTLWDKSDGTWEAVASVGDQRLTVSTATDPRACLRAVIEEVYKWAQEICHALEPSFIERLPTITIREEI